MTLSSGSLIHKFANLKIRFLKIKQHLEEDEDPRDVFTRCSEFHRGRTRWCDTLLRPMCGWAEPEQIYSSQSDQINTEMITSTGCSQVVFTFARMHVHLREDTR